MRPDPEPSAACGVLPPAAGAQVRRLPARADAGARSGRAQRPEPGVVIAPPRYVLAHALARSVGRPLVSGNRIELLDGGEPAWAALFDAIDRAREHVNLESPGRVNPALAAALAQRLMARAAAGVRVNLLLDGTRPGAARDAAVLRQAGVGVCVARRGPGRLFAPPDVPARQRSLVVVDGRIAFLGGLAPPWAERRGACLRVEGPAVALLQDLFVADWQRERGETLAHARYFPALRAEGPQRVALALQEGGAQGAPLRAALLAAIEAARQHVLLAGAPDAAVQAALAQAAARGVEVQWLLPARGEAPAGWRCRLGVAPAGLCLRRRRQPPLHADAACVVDGVWAAVGAMPPAPGRGAHAGQATLVVLDDAFGARIERLLRDDLAASEAVTDTDDGAQAAAPEHEEAPARGPWSRAWHWLAARLGARAAS